MSLPFVGPSNDLASRTADVQRTINMFPLPIEAGNTRAAWVFQDVPGKVLWSTIGGVPRGGKSLNGRAFIVFGSTLWEIFADRTAVSRGALASSSGFVGMDFNTIQLVVGDDANLYVLTLTTNVLSTYSYPGAGRVQYLDQYILYRERDSQQFGWSPLGDASTQDALNFASAEASPDDLVALFVDHREILLLGSNSVESWLATGGTDVFERNNGVAVEDGCASEWTVQKLDNSVAWVAASERGQGAVYQLQGYQPIRISTGWVEEKLAGVDLSGAYAYVYSLGKSNFYCLQVPALGTTLVYDAFSKQWHERSRWVNGEHQKDRGVIHLYAFGFHLVGANDGNLYALDTTVHNDAGDPLVRERISPDNATPNRKRVDYPAFHLDCDRGYGGQVQLRVSNDGAANWSAWATRDLGELGEFSGRVKWSRLGAGKDRVTQIRCSDDVPFNPANGVYG